MAADATVAGFADGRLQVVRHEVVGVYCPRGFLVAHTFVLTYAKVEAAWLSDAFEL